jgi:putative flippase GtrA
MRALTDVQRQLLRFAVVGAASNLVCYLIYLGLTRLGLGPKLAMSLLYAVGVMQTFVFNKKWTFEHGGAHSAVFVRYCIAYGAGYVINIIVLFVLVDQLQYPHELIQAGMILCLAVMLFLAQKFWVFAPDQALPSTNKDFIE